MEPINTNLVHDIKSLMSIGQTVVKFEYLKNCIVLGAAWANQELQFWMPLLVALFSKECKQCSQTYHELEKVLRQIRLNREMMEKKKNIFTEFGLRRYSSCFYISMVNCMCLRTLSN